MAKPTLAVFKFASCDGCQLTLLDCEDELLPIAELVTIANFPEASRAVLAGPYDVGLVEGSVTTPHDRERILEVRRQCRVLVTIGACATAGGIQALRNYADVAEFTAQVYARPDYISTLATSTPIADHVPVDYELRGCPISKEQLVATLACLVKGLPPPQPSHSVCLDCKRAGLVCVMVARGEPCLGPVTHTGCKALCPSFSRGCFGCYGPQDRPQTESMGRVWKAAGGTSLQLHRTYRGFNAGAPAFDEAGTREGSHE